MGGGELGGVAGIGGDGVAGGEELVDDVAADLAGGTEHRDL
jgi:hypothetical protein